MSSHDDAGLLPLQAGRVGEHVLDADALVGELGHVLAQRREQVDGALVAQAGARPPP